MKRFALVISFVFFGLMIFSGFSSAANIGFNGIGGKIGLVMPEDPIDNTLGFGVLVDLGTIIPNLKLEGCVDYWGKSYDESLFGSSYESSLSVINIGPTAKYHFPVGSFSAFAGGGVVLAYSRASWDVEGVDEAFLGGDTSDSDTDIDIPVVGGITMAIGSGMDFIAEARYLLDAETFWISGGIIVKLK